MGLAQTVRRRDAEGRQPQQNKETKDELRNGDVTKTTRSKEQEGDSGETGSVCGGRGKERV